MDLPSVEQIKALGESIVIPLATLVIGYLQLKCRNDLNIAHAKLRAYESGKPWQLELRGFTLYRNPKNRRPTDERTDDPAREGQPGGAASERTGPKEDGSDAGGSGGDPAV